MSPMDLGERLRAVRLKYGLSQRELARKAGIANGTISLIESNSISPSVGALKRILDSIPIGLSEFFSWDLARTNRLFYRASDLVEIGREGVSYRQVGSDLSQRSLQILSERYQPGADSGKVLLQHQGEEGGVITRGRLEVTVGSDRAVLGAGDAYYFDSRIPHRFRNPGDEICELVSACSPPTF
jgi:transcriptional regulator with XRE-family HTH domain